MAKTRTTLEQFAGNLEESLGVREIDLRPRLSPENGWKVTVTAQQKGSYDEIELALQLALEEVRTRISSGMRLF